MQGFSLIELVIVILVAAIVAVAAVPRLLDTSAIDAVTAAETAATDIRAVQSLAMYTGVPRSIAFSSGSPDYTAGGLLPPARRLPGGSYATTTISLNFNSFGEPNITAATDVSFYAGGNASSLTVLPYTGEVSVN